MATVPAERQVSVLHEAFRQFGARLFEAAPGLVTWILLLAPAWIPIVFPWPGAFAVVTGVYSTLWRMRRDMAKDWLAICLQDQKLGKHDPLQYYHLFILPTYPEPDHVVGG